MLQSRNLSKMAVIWVFCFEGNPRKHTIKLTHSVLSGKKLIEHNGRQVFASSTVRATGFDKLHPWSRLCVLAGEPNDDESRGCDHAAQSSAFVTFPS